MPPPAIDVVVVPRDRVSMFAPCLAALRKHTRLPFRLTVVAHGYDAGMARILTDAVEVHPGARVIGLPALVGQAALRNAGLDDLRARYCVFLENDTLVHPGWLETMLACMRDAHVAVVAPTVLNGWDGTIHAAGGAFDEGPGADAAPVFQERVRYQDRHVRALPSTRQDVDYGETHCLLVDREQLTDLEQVFDDVEPFDADVGLTLRDRRLRTVLEPLAFVTYAAPPPATVADIMWFAYRWNVDLWRERNRRFTRKWGMQYEPSHKTSFYRSQIRRLGLARWHANRITVAAANLHVAALRTLRSTMRSLQRA